ncbi:MAG: septum formation initiator family protein [bacterium]|nr:septum formation initiator family protein [bacterium]
MKRKLFLLAAVVFMAVIDVNLVREIVRLARSGERLSEAESRVLSLQKENEELKDQSRTVASDRFIEKEAREKLGLVRPGEVVVYVPEGEKKTVVSSLVDDRPNWKKWWDVFFGE